MVGAGPGGRLLRHAREGSRRDLASRAITLQAGPEWRTGGHGAKVDMAWIDTLAVLAGFGALAVVFWVARNLAVLAVVLPPPPGGEATLFKIAAHCDDRGMTTRHSHNRG
jgi:hypothetical protein